MNGLPDTGQSRAVLVGVGSYEVLTGLGSVANNVARAAQEATDSRAARKIVILDCCYRGRALGQMGSAAETVVAEASAEGTYALAAAAENKPAGQITLIRNRAYTPVPASPTKSATSPLTKCAWTRTSSMTSASIR
jgi:hypothetical protein